MSLLEPTSQTISYEVCCGNEDQRKIRFEHISVDQTNIGIKMIDKLVIKKGSTVLDLGCGTGYLTKVLSERVGPKGKVVAVDPDGERLKFAKEQYSASNIEYVQADDKTFPSGQYDIIFSNLVIHWIQDKKNFLKRVYLNLRPGGHFAFTTYDGIPAYPPIATTLFNLMDSNFFTKIFHEKLVYLPANDYQGLATNVWTQISVDTESMVTEWKNLDDLIVSTHVVLQEEFDPAKIDSNELKKLKEVYGHSTVIRRPDKLVKGILTK